MVDGEFLGPVLNPDRLRANQSCAMLLRRRRGRGRAPVNLASSLKSEDPVNIVSHLVHRLNCDGEDRRKRLAPIRLRFHTLIEQKTTEQAKTKRP